MSYRYTAIGDSLTTGFGALPGNGFVPVYRRMAEARLRSSVVYRNLGVNGLTTAGLEQRLRGNAEYRRSLQGADIITLSIGGNDLIQAAKASAKQPGSSPKVLYTALQECRENFSEIMGMLWQLKMGSRNPYIIRIVGLYNPYPRLNEATDWVMQFNRYASQYYTRNCGFASIYNSFAGNEEELLSIDHIHPNKRGYYVIAERLNTMGYGMLF